MTKHTGDEEMLTAGGILAFFAALLLPILLVKILGLGLDVRKDAKPDPRCHCECREEGK